MLDLKCLHKSKHFLIINFIDQKVALTSTVKTRELVHLRSSKCLTNPLLATWQALTHLSNLIPVVSHISRAHIKLAAVVSVGTIYNAFWCSLLSEAI